MAAAGSDEADRHRSNVQGLKKQVTRAEDAAVAVNDVGISDVVARNLGLEAGATACTDVTGFGLLGHLKHMVEASNVRATISAAAIPFFPGALELAATGVVPEASATVRMRRRWSSSQTTWRSLSASSRRMLRPREGCC